MLEIILFMVKHYSCIIYIYYIVGRYNDSSIFGILNSAIISNMYTPFLSVLQNEGNKFNFWIILFWFYEKNNCSEIFQL